MIVSFLNIPVTLFVHIIKSTTCSESDPWEGLCGEEEKMSKKFHATVPLSFWICVKKSEKRILIWNDGLKYKN